MHSSGVLQAKETEMSLRAEVDELRATVASYDMSSLNSSSKQSAHQENSHVSETEMRELRQEVCDLKQQLKERTEQLQSAVSMGMGMDGMEWVM